ncbi:hypothetical protein J6590_094657 [Homalodisca vitripennis]|nr:hypothetical protein J6590_094657 [Homalodisca vitripennis]
MVTPSIVIWRLRNQSDFTTICIIHSRFASSVTFRIKTRHVLTCCLISRLKHAYRVAVCNPEVEIGKGSTFYLLPDITDNILLPLYDSPLFPYSWSSRLFFQMVYLFLDVSVEFCLFSRYLELGFLLSSLLASVGRGHLRVSVVGVLKSKLAARSLDEPARCFGVNIDPVVPNSVYKFCRKLVAERGLKWKARLAGGSGRILHNYES